jgi:membrane protein
MARFLFPSLSRRRIERSEWAGEGIVPVSDSKALRFGKKVAKEFSTDDINGLAAELSYRYFLALFPFFIFLAALGGFIAHSLNVSDPTASVMNAIGDALPSDARSVLETQLHSVLDSHNAGLLSIGIIGALWAASGAMKAMMKALNRIYDVPETRGFVKTTGIAVGMTLAATVGILGSFALMLATQAGGKDIADWFGADNAFAVAVSVVRWPIVIALLITAVALLYWLAPNIDVPFKWITAGSALFTVVWLATTVGLGLYVTNFNAYNKTYGTLGGVVVLLTWLYLTNVVLLLGAEINAIIDADQDPEKTRARREAVTSQASNTQQKKSVEPHAEGAAMGVPADGRTDAANNEPGGEHSGKCEQE